MSNETQKAIEKMYKLLSDERRWTKGAPARDASGFPVPSYSRHASSYCLVGAASVSCPTYSSFAEYDNAKRAVRALTGQRGIAAFNDSKSTKHADVLDILRRAHKAAGNGEPEVYL